MAQETTDQVLKAIRINFNGFFVIALITNIGRVGTCLSYVLPESSWQCYIISEVKN